jgi:hypothetical protein
MGAKGLRRRPCRKPRQVVKQMSRTSANESTDRNQHSSEAQSALTGRLALVGSRTFIQDISLICNDHVAYVDEAVRRSGFQVETLLCGGADGADTAGEQWAQRHDIDIEYFEPRYDRHPGKQAPIIRNTNMVAMSSAVIALWNGESSGTADAIEKARRFLGEEQVFVHRYRESPFDI